MLRNGNRLPMLMFFVMLQPAAVLAENPKAGSRSTRVVPAPIKDDHSRSWHFRVSLQFATVSGTNEYLALGAEFSVEMETRKKHVIQLVGYFGTFNRQYPNKEVESWVFGGGIGYAYSVNFLRNIVRLELGAAAGMFVTQMLHRSNAWGFPRSYTTFCPLLLRPNLLVGHKTVYFSVGPRMFVGFDAKGLKAAGGGSAGVTFRF